MESPRTKKIKTEGFPKSHEVATQLAQGESPGIKKNEAVPPQHYLSPNQIKPNYS
jgi:hypothetical protein